MMRFLQQIVDALERGRRFVAHDVWRIGLPGEEIPHGLIIKHIRVAILLVKGLVRDDLMLRASALTFATILAVVPFLAITFFLIQTFNVGESIAEWLAPIVGRPATDTLSPDSQKNRFIALLFQGFDQTAGSTGEPLANPVNLIVKYAERSANAGTLTLAGLIFVLTTVFGLMMNIENCFNRIWGVGRRRSWYRIFSDYVMILLLLPFLVAGVLSVTAILESTTISERLGPFAFGLSGVKYVVSWLVFAALYFLVPNTRVKFRYALPAGVIAGTGWCLVSLAYVRFQFGLPRYNILYSTFAQVPVLLMWLYLSWLILLVGAEITFAYQNEKTFAMERFAERASYAYREAVGLWAMTEICKRFDGGLSGLSVSAAAEAWNIPTRLLNETLRQLEEARLVVQSATNPPTYQPARSIDKITAAEVITCLHEAGQEPSALRQDTVFRRLVDKVRTCPGGPAACTIGDLIRETAAQAPAETGRDQG
jgi:membrane protein